MRSGRTSRRSTQRRAEATIQVLGIDVGGTGVKGAPVDTISGKPSADRYRIDTPRPATPEAVAKTICAIVDHFRWTGPIGCALPAVVKDGRIRTAANISKRWIGVDAGRLLNRATRRPVSVINDADAAGYAEMTFGAGRKRSGTVIMVTLGTGIGTALFINGHLLPNTELGHLILDGRDAEKKAAASVREEKQMSWKRWTRRVDAYLHLLNAYLWPDLFIIGGGVSTQHAKFLPYLTQLAPVVPAQLRNEAGIIGAALAYEHEKLRARAKRSLG